jgi:hypothetical protein
MLSATLKDGLGDYGIGAKIRAIVTFLKLRKSGNVLPRLDSLCLWGEPAERPSAGRE